MAHSFRGGKGFGEEQAVAVVVLTLAWWTAWLAEAVAFALVGVAVVGLPRRVPRLTEVFVEAVVLHCVGLSVVSLGVLLLGLAKVFGAGSVGALLIVGVGVGLWRSGLLSALGRGEWAAACRERWCSARTTWASQALVDRWMLVLSAVPLAALLVALMIGGLAPDVGQDSIWYHLTVPGQWVLRGDVHVSPNVLQSAYTLGFEADYAAVLAVARNETLVCGLVVQWMMAGLLLQGVAAWHWGGARGAMLAMAVAPGMLAGVTGPPVGAKNDAGAALMLAVSVWLVLRALHERRPLTWREVGCVAWTSALAVAGKLPAALFWAPTLMVAAVVCWRTSASPRRALTRLAVAVAVSAAIYAPWLARAGIETGNPLIQVAPRAMAVAPEFEPLVQTLELFPRVHGLHQWREALASLPHRLATTAIEGFAFFFLLPIAGLVALASRARPGGWAAGAIVLSWMPVMVLLDGASETARYFAVAYAAAAPAIGVAMALIAGGMAMRLRVALAVVLLATTWAVALKRHAHWAAFPTIQWKHYPLVLEHDRRAWAAVTELASEYAPLVDARPALPADARVLALGTHGPYHLWRRAEWSDFAVPPVLDRWWGRPDAEGALDADAARADLVARGITHVFSLDARGIDDPRLRALIEDGSLERIATSGAASTCGVWRVRAATSTAP